MLFLNRNEWKEDFVRRKFKRLRLNKKGSNATIDAALVNVGLPTQLITAPQDRLMIMQLFLHLLHCEAKDITLKWVFDHVRNYIICGAVMWAGIKGFTMPAPLFIDSIIFKLGGAVLIFSSVLLFSLNMGQGITGFSRICNLKKVGIISYMTSGFLLFFAAQVLLFTAKGPG